MRNTGINKKLVVINPVRDEFRRAKRRAFLPPSTLSVLASLTPSDWDVALLDENIAAFEEEGQIEKIEGADMVGISVMTSEAHRAYEIADRVRKMGKTVVLGGYHITACPDEALEHADAVVVGRAESTRTFDPSRGCKVRATATRFRASTEFST